MNRVLRKKSLQALMPFLILTAVLAIALLLCSGGSVIKLFRGDSTVNETLRKGQYVSTDASNVIVAFATLSETTDQGKENLKTYYLLPCGDKYIAVMDSKDRNAELLNKAMEQSKAFYLDKSIDSLRSLGLIFGTVADLEEDMQPFMTDCIANYDLPGSDASDLSSLILPYQVNLDRVGFLPVLWVWILFGAGVVCLAVFLALLIPVYRGKYQKEVLAVENAEEFFDKAKTIERIQVGQYIFYQQGATTKVIETAQLVWGYALPEPLVVSKYRWPVALYNRDQEFIQICFMDKKNCSVFLDEIAAQGGAFVSGYSTELAGRFKNDFDSFCKLAEDNRIRA